MIDFVISFIILDDIILPHELDISIKDHDCGDHIEKLYYSYRYQRICMYCGEYLDDADEDASTYPQCLDCEEPEISKRWKDNSVYCIDFIVNFNFVYISLWTLWTLVLIKITIT